MIEARPLGDDVVLRVLGLEDAEALAVAHTANRERIARTGPDRPDSFFTPAGQWEALQRMLAEHAAGTAVPLGMVAGDAVVGRVSVSSIIRGNLQSATIGYWIDEAWQGRGLTSRAVAAVVEIARDDLGLHRLEAGTLLDNHASQAVLRRNGFEEFGLARRLLLINGEWRDHRLFQRLLDE